MNTITIPDHKHCIYCGKSNTVTTYEGLACKSAANPVTPTTNGQKPHVYLADGDWPPKQVTFHNPETASSSQKVTQ